jgi:phosphopantothenate synthetase
MRKKLVLEELTIKNKFDLNGVAFINKINTDSVSMGSIKIDSNKLMFSNEAAKIMVGDDVITAKEFFKIVKSMKNLQIKCGENLEKCKPIDNNYLIKQEKKEVINEFNLD